MNHLKLKKILFEKGIRIMLPDEYSINNTDLIYGYIVVLWKEEEIRFVDCAFGETLITYSNVELIRYVAVKTEEDIMNFLQLEIQNKGNIPFHSLFSVATGLKERSVQFKTSWGKNYGLYLYKNEYFQFFWFISEGHTNHRDHTCNEFPAMKTEYFRELYGRYPEEISSIEDFLGYHGFLC